MDRLAQLRLAEFCSRGAWGRAELFAVRRAGGEWKDHRLVSSLDSAPTKCLLWGNVLTLSESSFLICKRGNTDLGGLLGRLKVCVWNLVDVPFLPLEWL